MKLLINKITLAAAIGFLTTVSPLHALSGTYSAIPVADTFVTDGTKNEATANGNYGGAGALMVAGSASASANGTFESLLMFNLSGAATQFNSQFGTGDWTITSVTLTLAGNNGIQGQQPNNAIFPTINAGSFTITLMSNDTWLEGTGNPSNPTTDGVTYDTLSSYLGSGDTAVGTYSYVPPGNNVQQTWAMSDATGFQAEIVSGSDVSLLVSPADTTIGYLFNSRSYTASNRPLITVTAIPEPGAYVMALAGFAGLVLLRRRR